MRKQHNVRDFTAENYIFLFKTGPTEENMHAGIGNKATRQKKPETRGSPTWHQSHDPLASCGREGRGNRARVHLRQQPLSGGSLSKTLRERLRPAPGNKGTRVTTRPRQSALPTHRRAPRREAAARLPGPRATSPPGPREPPPRGPCPGCHCRRRRRGGGPASPARLPRPDSSARAATAPLPPAAASQPHLRRGLRRPPGAHAVGRSTPALGATPLRPSARPASPRRRRPPPAALSRRRRPAGRGESSRPGGRVRGGLRRGGGRAGLGAEPPGPGWGGWAGREER